MRKGASRLHEKTKMMLPRPHLSCRAPWWADSGHQQTVLGNFLPEPPLDIPSEPFEVALVDGDRLAGFSLHVGGALIHLLLVGIVALFLFNLLTGRGARV